MIVFSSIYNTTSSNFVRMIYDLFQKSKFFYLLYNIQDDSEHSAVDLSLLFYFEILLFLV